MNPLALELNEVIQKQYPQIHQVLSKLGKNLYFPRGILSQSADAQKKANKYNVTIGIATEGAGPMYLPCIQKIIKEIPPQESYPYAPGAGKPQLREKWQKKLLADNPSMQGKNFSVPIVTSGLTHGLELAADLEDFRSIPASENVKDVDAVKVGSSRCGAGQEEHAPCGGGFSASALPHESQRFTLSDLERDVVHRSDQPRLFGAEDPASKHRIELDQFLDTEQDLCCRPSVCHVLSPPFIARVPPVTRAVLCALPCIRGVILSGHRRQCARDNSLGGPRQPPRAPAGSGCTHPSRWRNENGSGSPGED